MIICREITQPHSQVNLVFGTLELKQKNKFISLHLSGLELFFCWSAILIFELYSDPEVDAPFTLVF